MADGTLSAEFSVDGPGGTIDLAISRTIASMTVGNVANVGVSIASSTETTVWQSVNHANGSAFTPEFNQIAVALVPADGNTLVKGTDIFQLGLYFTPIAGGSAVHRLTITANAETCLLLGSLLAAASTVVPSATPNPLALTKITVAREAGTKTARVVVAASN